MAIANRVLAETFRFLDDALRALDKISEEVNDLLGLQRQYIRQTAAITLQVNIPGPKASPTIEVSKADNIKIQGLEKLKKNYTIVQELWVTKEALELMEVKIRQAFANKDVDTNKAIGELAKLKKRVEMGLTEAFTFLKSLADKNLPEKFATFNKAVFSILEKSIAYEKATPYSYVYEVEGDLVFSTYIQLARVIDDDGTYYPELYIITSYRVGQTTAMYVGVLTAFIPPSSKLLMKKVATVKETVRALNILLALDNFATAIGSLPISMLLKDPTIDKGLFLYQNFIKSIKIDEEQVIFTLKPEVVEKALADKVMAQIWKDFQQVVRKTNAKLRMHPRFAQKCWVLTFMFTTPNGTLFATEDDLSFLKDRFQLSDTSIRDIVKTINSSSPV